MTDASSNSVANIQVVPVTPPTPTVPATGVLTVPLGNFYSSDNLPATGSTVPLTGCALTTSGLVDTPIQGTISTDVIQFPNTVTTTDTTGANSTYPVIGVRLPDGTRKIGTPTGITITDAQRTAARTRIDKKKSAFAETRRAAMARANLRKAAGNLPQTVSQTQLLTPSQLTTTSNDTPIITQVTGAAAQDVEVQSPYSITSQNTQDTSTVAASEMVTKEYFSVG